ncbi:Uncharacterized [Moorella glycerini]|uniref:Uncharacterized protein n=1 Tax=Neomoorella stamsii TaxID=1266720 RepID=A0A9X7J4J3_9FIRM|nr:MULTISPECIES: hypothetical protein [Moorella]PRR76045.1 hypothetical protein MOST_06660 [Moorella stamsii]CEP68349.1 Uncharacterized [Moorella glycerini]
MKRWRKIAITIIAVIATTVGVIRLAAPQAGKELIAPHLRSYGEEHQK